MYSQWSTDPANPLFVDYGILPEMCSDGAGGCYITSELGYPTELSLWWFNKYGFQPWGWKKIIAGTHTSQSSATLLPDGEGGVIIAFEDRNAWGSKSTLRLQRIDTIGNFLWGPTGVVPSIADTMQGVARLLSDGDEGCIILWLENNNSGLITRLNRINRFGQRVWSDTGSYIALHGTNKSELIACNDGNYFIYNFNALFKINNIGEVIWSKYIPFGGAISDGDNGLFEYSQSWENPANHKLLARRIDSNGINLWPSSVVVAESLYYNAFLEMIRTQNYFVFSWYGMKNGVNNYQFHMLRMDGSKVFNESIQLPNAVANLMPADSARVYFHLSDSSLIAQCYDTLGNQLFNGNGVIVATPTMEDVKNTTDGNGGLIVAGTFLNSSIVVQKVSRNGILGEVIIPVELTSFSAEIIRNNVLLKWKTATETNNKGFEIERITDAGTKVIGFVPGRGTTTEITDYMYEDRDELNGSIKYRLKQIDLDGTYEYSNTVEVNIGTPADFILFQNYPNPFNSTTVIKFLIPRQEETRLSIFNILGQEIHTILNEKIEAGFYTYNYDASAQPSGVYFIRLKAGNFISIRKIVLLK